jgi:glycosyltransferase involved in cell wall biosynthesis
MPHQVTPVPGRWNVNYTMVEATRIPAAWLRANLRHDLVLVPTESSRAAWLASGFPVDRIRVSPLGVDTDRFRPGVAPLTITGVPRGDVARYRARILNISELGPRKNLLALLRVWIRATRATDDAVLIIKLAHPGSLETVRFMRALAAMERALGRTRAEAAPIVFLDRPLTDDEVPSLHAAATHYWSMSHGEAWDQPMHEAAATGLELLAPRHSAYASFLDERVAWMIPARTVPAVVYGVPVFGAGAEWWEPDEEAAGARIRHAVRRPGERKPSVRPWLVGEVTWPQAVRRLLDHLDRLPARPRSSVPSRAGRATRPRGG